MSYLMIKIRVVEMKMKGIVEYHHQNCSNVGILFALNLHNCYKIFNLIILRLIFNKNAYGSESRKASNKYCTVASYLVCPACILVYSYYYLKHNIDYIIIHSSIIFDGAADM